ncbi:activating signal cointegrator 1 complex subunit [Nowakowskiella sp. JEL0078]|nr:activating signal cointegrator 1 complex subunit [Nowakowskiella sp. JEL0078]
MDNLCWDKVRDLVVDGSQVMVFVHSRKDTVKTAQYLRDQANQENMAGVFDATQHEFYGVAMKEINKSRNREMKELFSAGFGIHHAGMLRSDRTITERYFEKGLTKVLCCTATLAWGVNLPAFAVVIKGTSVYDATKGGFVDLSILDVLQIFGRAGRPQYEDHGLGYILTTHDKLNHYVSAMTQQHPIESSFSENLYDNLNAEISLGTVTNVEEAIKWLSYTYLHVRMRKNPFHYGIEWADVQNDPTLYKRRNDLIVSAAQRLHKSQMILYDHATGYLTPKDLGRTASGYYIRTATVEVFNEIMRPRMNEADVLSMVSMSTEFENIKVREEETTELKKLMENQCVCAIKGGVDTSYGKANILLQGFISRSTIEDFALISDSGYVAQNSARILRALFDICVSRSWGPVSAVVLSLCKAVDRRMWSFEHPLAQFDLPYDIVQKIENNKGGMSIEEMREMDVKELGELIRHQKMASTVMKCLEKFPVLILDATIAPITRTVLKGTIEITADFIWSDKIHGSIEPWWIFVEDGENTEILHHEYFLLTKQMTEKPQKLIFTIPIPKVNSTVDELPPQIFIRAVSNKWIGAETVLPVSFKHLILPAMYRNPHTNLLDLQPLPISALHDPVLEEICLKRFQYFNPVQTQIFHTLYRTQHNALVGAPTGSGKTVAAELALWYVAAFRDNPNAKVVYVAPLKALVRERVQDWQERLMGPMNRQLIELTGDVTPDLKTIQNADVIITTPEKWDGISRSWQTRSYVTSVSLVIIDEIHLLGSDRGPILEVIVSRMNYMASQIGKRMRFVGLSTALANANDLADWLGIKDVGLFNFKHSVRPVPLEIYIDGFAGKHYCPRMGTMNKPTYSAIMTHSPTKPVIVFVSSRRQTRLTAVDLISLCAMDSNPKRFLHMPDEDIINVVAQVKDIELRNALEFGIGLHHAGLVEGDRKIVEELFLNNKVQILIATSTLAWGVNFPAHLVVIKGTEFYDAKTKGYVDFPITDVLQMMGRAGRPQFDDSGVARIFVQDIKKNFYKKFLHEPFPVESNLHTVLHDHLNAEIVSKTITSKQDAVDYLTWTYLYRRLQMNPTYYGVEDLSENGVNIHLSKMVEKTLRDLEESFCVQIDGMFVEPTALARIASFYYIHHTTMRTLKTRLTSDYRFEGDFEVGERADGDFGQMLRTLSDVPEYSEIPVRHNEDKINMTLVDMLPIPVTDRWALGMSTFGNKINNPIQGFESPHVKTFLLFQAHLSRLSQLPIADYVTDQVTILDSSIRISQAMVDVAADQGFLNTTTAVMKMLQCIKQALWPLDSPLLSLPHITKEKVNFIRSPKTGHRLTLKELVDMKDANVNTVLSNIPGLTLANVENIKRVIWNMPSISILWTVEGGRATSSDGTKPSRGYSTNTNWIIDGGTECVLKIEITRKRPYKKLQFYQQHNSGRDDYCIYAPRFPKPQTESWWIVLGEREVDDLLALKRIAPASVKGAVAQENQMNVKDDGRVLRTDLKFILPSEPRDYELYLSAFCDGYLGLDHEISFIISPVLGDSDAKPNNQRPAVSSPNHTDVKLPMGLPFYPIQRLNPVDLGMDAQLMHGGTHIGNSYLNMNSAGGNNSTYHFNVDSQPIYLQTFHAPVPIQNTHIYDKVGQEQILKKLKLQVKQKSDN